MRESESFLQPNLNPRSSLIRIIYRCSTGCSNTTGSTTQKVLDDVARGRRMPHCYGGKHHAHSYYKSKKVLDINTAPMKSSVYVNGVSNRRGVWRHHYEWIVVFCKEYRFCA